MARGRRHVRAAAAALLLAAGLALLATQQGHHAGAGPELLLEAPEPAIVDPAQASSTADEELLRATCSNLLYHPAGGAGLAPEIAAALPAVSADGRTYTFTIRRGYRFSPPSNAPITAETFKQTIERALSPKLGEYAAGAPWIGDVAGVLRYRTGRARHISGIVAHGRRLSITLVRPAGDFGTRISMPFFCPVPPRTPVVSGSTAAPIPSAGPYYVVSSTTRETVLERNPNYAGPRPRHAARIVETVGRAGATVLEQEPFVAGIVLNAARPLFRDARLRRAVNEALDRPAVAAALGDAPADALVPPAVSDFPAGAAYPLAGPDLTAARRLAEGAPRRARLFYCIEPPFGAAGERHVAERVRADLARIGIAVSIVASQSCPAIYDAATLRADLLLFASLGSPERDPGPFLGAALASGRYGAALGPGLWTTSAFRKRVAVAALLRGEARWSAYLGLARKLSAAAPYAIFGSAVSAALSVITAGCGSLGATQGLVDLGALCTGKS